MLKLICINKETKCGVFVVDDGSHTMTIILPKNVFKARWANLLFYWNKIARKVGIYIEMFRVFALAFLILLNMRQST